jgi:hypothetical protein
LYNGQALHSSMLPYLRTVLIDPISAASKIRGG